METVLEKQIISTYKINISKEKLNLVFKQLQQSKQLADNQKEIISATKNLNMIQSIKPANFFKK